MADESSFGLSVPPEHMGHVHDELEVYILRLCCKNGQQGCGFKLWTRGTARTHQPYDWGAEVWTPGTAQTRGPCGWLAEPFMASLTPLRKIAKNLFLS